MPKYGALVYVEDAGLGGMGCRVLDFLAGAALLAESVERELPGDVGLEMVRFAARPKDQVLVFGALRDKGANLILS